MADDQGDMQAPKVDQVLELYDDGSVTVAHAAALLGCSRETINNHVRDGAPAAFRGKAGKSSRISIKSYVSWLMERQEQRLLADFDDEESGDGESFNEKREKARRAKFAADITEMDARERSRELVTIDAAAQALSDEQAAVRSALSNIPGRLSTRVATMTDAREIRGYLQREIDGVLRDLCDGDVLAQRASDITIDGIAGDPDDA